MNPTFNLLRQVRARMNRRVLGVSAAGGLVMGAAVVLVAALFWLPRGHELPVGVTVGAAVLAGLVAAVRAWRGWVSLADAARRTDQVFALKDGLVTAMEMPAPGASEASDRFWAWLAPRLAEVEPRRVVGDFPRRSMILAVVLPAMAAWVATRPPAAEVVAAREDAAATAGRMAETKKELEKWIEEVAAASDEEEKEAMEMDALRKLVARIEPTGDRAEAARQIARIEQKVREAAAALENRKDEEALKAAIRELLKATEADPKELAKKLDARELRAAAEDLKKLAPAKPGEAKPMTAKQQQAQAKENLAKLRAVSKRLAAAAKARDAGGKPAGRQDANADGKAETKASPGKVADGDARAGQGEAALDQAMQELDAEVEKLAEELEEWELRQMENAEFVDPEALEQMEKVAGKLGRLGDKWRKMHGRQQARAKLLGMGQSLSNARKFSQGQEGRLSLAMPGGKQPGRGSDWRQRAERDAPKEGGELSALKGRTDGQGPSLSAVEEADSGSARSNRRGEARQRDFSREVESFVQREDVPEPLKLGVRDYFESLQSPEPAANSGGGGDTAPPAPGT